MVLVNVNEYLAVYLTNVETVQRFSNTFENAMNDSKQRSRDIE